MKKFLCILILIILTMSDTVAQVFETWVSDINPNKGHITYTVNTLMPIENDTILAKNRRDYICSQNKEAVLWATATYLSSGKTIDYSMFVDEDKYKKYGSLNQYDYERIQQIVPYCH